MAQAQANTQVQPSPITLEQAKTLSYRTTLYHVTLRNVDGTALRARVNGQVKTWKRNSARVRVPMAHGLMNYDCFYLTEDNLSEWLLEDPTRTAKEA